MNIKRDQENKVQNKGEFLSERVPEKAEEKHRQKEHVSNCERERE